MRKLMSLILVFGVSSFMVTGCGGGSSGTTATTDTTTNTTTDTTTDTTTNTTTDTTTVYLKDIIKDESSAKIAFYKAVSTNSLDDLEDIIEIVSGYIGNGTESINGELYSEEVCGNYTVDANAKTFTFNFDNCWNEISGQLSGSYEVDNGTVSSINISLSDGFSCLYDYKDTFYGTTVSAEYAYYDNGTFETTYTITADKIEYRYIPEDNETTILPCFNETDIAATLTDVKATIKESHNGDSNTYTWSQNSSYKVEWPPFINAPVMMDYEEFWSEDNASGTETDYYLKIADGTIVVDSVNCSEDESGEDTCTFDLKYNGSVIYTGTFEDLENELISDLNEDGVCETLTIYP